MKNTLAGLSALTVCAGFLLPAWGADDVVQPACWLRRDPPPPRTSGYLAVQTPVAVPTAEPCCPQPTTCNSCPQTTCTQQYTLQSYYKSVTTYQTQTNYEPVTTYRTSYYYEPVTTYRTSCYYCPNSCSWKQTQVPETSYVLKSSNCPVQSYVAKYTQVPVTSCQKVYYYQPQTVCTQSPPPCCPTPAPCCAAAPAPCQGCQPGGTGAPVNPPTVTPTPGPTDYRPPIVDTNQDKYYRKETAPPPLNGNGGSSSWQPVSPPPSTPAPIATPAPSSPNVHTVKLDRIILGADAAVDGEVVHADKTPRADAKILFVNANQPAMRETVTTNQAGRFSLTLCPGGWLVYLYNVDGDAVYHSRVEVNDDATPRIVLVK